MKAALYKSNFELAKGTPYMYLALKGELWVLIVRILEKIDGTALYL